MISVLSVGILSIEKEEIRTLRLERNWEKKVVGAFALLNGYFR